ncbi:hypothetical protein BgAZ_300820 [Babesia gibsoni]|uniref:C3H1-type domain-containing protein n=1 Tax=Babesia gibsoni TaxID=33632 RepID=A0AAD8PDB3_BABGI|nr:hypothetical protein BgAZ_300820 [Babesia gibsoni]
MVSVDHASSNLTDDVSTKKKRKRSKEAAERKRQKYLEILRRRRENKVSKSQTAAPNDVSAPLATSGRVEKRICKYFYRTGACNHGENCSFSHDCIPLNKKELKLCSFYLRGTPACKYSDEECKFSHNPSLFLCRHVVIQGTCDNEQCMFQHPDADSIDALDDAEKLRFCYNNKRYLTSLLANTLGLKLEATAGTTADDTDDHRALLSQMYMDESQLQSLPWYLNYIYTLVKRDNELYETS